MQRALKTPTRSLPTPAHRTRERARGGCGAGGSQTSFSGSHCSLIGSNPGASAAGRPHLPPPPSRLLHPSPPPGPGLRPPVPVPLHSARFPPPTPGQQNQVANSFQSKGVRGRFLGGNLAGPATAGAGGSEWAEPDAVRGSRRAASSQGGSWLPELRSGAGTDSMLWTKAPSRLGDSKQDRGGP